MSNHRIECQLDLVIHLLETLPVRMCEAIEEKEEYEKEIKKMMLKCINKDA